MTTTVVDDNSANYRALFATMDLGVIYQDFNVENKKVYSTEGESTKILKRC